MYTLLWLLGSLLYKCVCVCVCVFGADTIDKWDEEKLKEVVQKKHGGKTKQKTDIVSYSTGCCHSANKNAHTHTCDRVHLNQVFVVLNSMGQ